MYKYVLSPYFRRENIELSTTCVETYAIKVFPREAPIVHRKYKMFDTLVRPKMCYKYYRSGSIYLVQNLQRMKRYYV